jgi:DNA polymerase III subunit gamma/tau
MLRTYDEIGYRQEQRFHLELGILKLVHAQRILPLEQVLSQVASETGGRPAGGPRQPAPMHGTSSSSGSPERKAEPAVSPFAADRARKTRSEPEMADATLVRSQTTTTAAATAVAVAEAPTRDPGSLLGHVVGQLDNAGYKMVAHLLESGSATLERDELKVTVAQPPSVIELMMGQEQKRLANAAASTAAGRAVKVSVVSGSPPSNGTVARPSGNGNSATARSRAAEDPVVQRMQEKFRAEIRTVIDHRDKN